jgi:hypothetical protein
MGNETLQTLKFNKTKAAQWPTKEKNETVDMVIFSCSPF